MGWVDESATGSVNLWSRPGNVSEPATETERHAAAFRLLPRLPIAALD